MLPLSQGASGERAVLSMEACAPLTAAVVLEPGFVVSALERSDEHHEACSMFLERIVRARTVLYYNDLFELELHEKAFELAAREVQGRRRDPVRVVRYTEPAVHVLADDLLRRWHSIVVRADAVHVEVPNLLEDVRYFMERHGLSAAHAVHAGMVVASEADGIATVDERFADVDDTLLRLYTPDRLVGTARQRRPPDRRAA